MLAPSLVLFGVFVFYPLVRTFYLGLHQNDFFGGQPGVRRVPPVRRRPHVSSDFRHSLWVTVEYALLTVPIGLALGIGLAVLADKRRRGIGIFRTVFSSTVATSRGGGVADVVRPAATRRSACCPDPAGISRR